MNRSGGAKIVRMPAAGCRSLFAGRCLYGEQLNPGWAEATHCRVLRRWEAVYDDFLDRAENFGLAESRVPELWRRRFLRLAGEFEKCPDFAWAPGAGVFECRFLFVDLCLLRLPVCAGMCRNFHPAGDD